MELLKNTLTGLAALVPIGGIILLAERFPAAMSYVFGAGIVLIAATGFGAVIRALWAIRTARLGCGMSEGLY